MNPAVKRDVQNNPENFDNQGKRICSSKPELLAPAGTMMSFLAAVRNGADAVYLGGGKFSARAYAGNFSLKELAIAIDYAHIFGVFVHVTMNTLYRDSEFQDLFDMIRFLYEAGADALIVQDVGLLSLLKTTFPDFPIHASTQMTVHNVFHCLLLKQEGVCRIVPARELSLSELQNMKQTGLEIETFVHGALCICYSGQCFFSSFIGGRSGNRGQCAQPCRKKYDLVAVDPEYLFSSSKKKGSSIHVIPTSGHYLLSPRDLNATSHLYDLVSIGIDSFKIEGRMKRYEYVGGVVSVYRRIIDRYFNYECDSENLFGRMGLTQDEHDILRKLFNRDFTDGYFSKNPENELMSRRLPYNRGFAVGLIEKADPYHEDIHIRLSSTLSVRDGISVGNIKNRTEGSQDPRSGFTIRKMFSNGRICDSAGPGEIVSVPAPLLFQKKPYPEPGDSVYVTSDEKLHIEIESKMPHLSEDEIYGLMEKNVSSVQFAQAVGGFPLKVPVSFFLVAHTGKLLRITAYDSESNEVTSVSDFIVQKACKTPFTKQKAYDILSSVGNTFFVPVNINIDTDSEIFIPVGVLKDLRNRVLSSFLEKKIESFKRTFDGISFNIPKMLSKNSDSLDSDFKTPTISVVVYTKEAVIKSLAAGADRIYVGGSVYTSDPMSPSSVSSSYDSCSFGLSFEDVCSVLSSGKISKKDMSRIFYRFPQITKDSVFPEFETQIPSLLKYGIGGFVASNPGVLYFLKDYKIRNPDACNFSVISDISFNVFNSHAACFFVRKGVECVSLSPEMSLSDIRNYVESCRKNYGCIIPSECLVYGPIQVMVTEHPLIENLLSTESKKHKKNKSAVYALCDSKNYLFPVFTDENRRNHIFNSKILNTIDFVEEIYKAGISGFRIDGFGLTSEEIRCVIYSYRAALAGKPYDMSFLRSDLCNRTKGMYMREVI